MSGCKPTSSPRCIIAPTPLPGTLLLLTWVGCCPKSHPLCCMKLWMAVACGVVTTVVSRSARDLLRHFLHTCFPYIVLRNKLSSYSWHFWVSAVEWQQRESCLQVLRVCLTERHPEPNAEALTFQEVFVCKSKTYLTWVHLPVISVLSWSAIAGQSFGGEKHMDTKVDNKGSWKLVRAVSWAC